MPTTVPSLLPSFARHASLHRSLWCGPNLISILADGAETGGRIAVMEVAGKEGSEPPPHTHTVDDELFYLLSGEVEFRIGHETVRAGKGDTLFLPHGVEHGFRILNEEFHALVVTAPAGLEAAFRELCRPAPALRVNPVQPLPSPAEMAEVFAARGIVFRPPHLAPPYTRPNPTKVRRSGLGRSRWFEGQLVTPLLTAAESRQFAVVDFKVSPGVEPPRHSHQNEDELYYILDGEAEFFVGDDVYSTFAGTLVFVPRGTAHHLKVESNSLRALLIITPPGFERFFIEHSTDATSLTRPPVATSSLRAEERVEANRRYGFELVPVTF
ncbi:MAG: cupin domain-containing protein [Opitutaceae bacterium]